MKIVVYAALVIHASVEKNERQSIAVIIDAVGFSIGFRVVRGARLREVDRQMDDTHREIQSRLRTCAVCTHFFPNQSFCETKEYFTGNGILHSFSDTT